MKSKKIFSLVLMCAMMFTSMPITGFADVAGLINPAEKAKMELVLMDYDEGITDDNISLNEGKIHEIAPSQIPASGEFLVAIRIGDLRRITEGSKGIYSANVTVRFDPTYLEIEPITTLKGRAQHRVGRNKIYDEDGSYGLVKGAMGIAPSASGSNMSQSVNIMFEFGDALTSPTYKGDEDALIGAIKFKKLNDAPEGTKVLDFEVASGIYASCSFGIAGEDKYTAAGVSDMIPLFTWDVSRVNLFPGKVNLTYHDNVPGGAVIQSGSVEGQTQTVVEGTSVAESVQDGKMLKAPVIPGYVFEGWFTEAAGGTEVTKDTKINEAQDLYAHWAEGYAVTFDPNSGQIDGKDDPKVVKLGKVEKIAKKDVPLNEKLTRKDYIFAGWNTKANGTGIMLADPDAVVGHEFNYTSATLYAQWTANGTEQVTVTFDGNGATTEANPTSITLNKGDKIGTGMPDEPKRTNYKFKEWNTKQNGTGDEFTGEIKINETQKVYAQWEAEGNDSEKATVTFKDDGDTHAKPDKITIRKGDKIGKGNMPNAPIKAEYVFDKWIVDADKNGKIDNGETTEFTGDEIVADDMQVVAAWKSDVTVTFHVRNGKIDGESLATKEITVKYGNSLENEGKALPVATSNVEGYVFWGWKTKDNGGGDEFKVDTAVVKDIDVYALFQKAGPPDGPGEEPKPKENAVKIVFDKNGGTKDADPKEWIIDKAHSFDSVFGDFPTKPERENYDFVNWNTQKNGMGKTAKLSDKPEDLLKKSDDTVLNLYAQWTVAANTDPANKVKVDFLWNDEGAHSNPYRTINLFKGDAVGRDNVPDDPERAGYSFDKWVYVDGGADFDPEAAVDKNIEVKATWKKQVSVKFYRNDDNAQPEKTLLYTKVLNTGEEFKKADMPADPEARAGYKFLRWETADGEKFNGGNINADTAVYAQWAKEIQFTFKDATVTYNGKVQKLALPTITDLNGDPVDLTLDEDYTVTYAKDGASGVAVDPKDAGKYEITVSIVDKKNTKDTYELNKVTPTKFTITKKPLQFKVDSEQKVKTDGTKAQPIEISCTTEAPVPDSFTIKYALWTDSNKDGKIANSELSEFKEEAPKDHGKYVVKVEISDNENYIIELNGWVVGEVYDLNSDYADNQAPTVGGQNLKYELTANAELTALTVKDTATNKHLDLYGVAKDLLEAGDKVPYAADTLEYYVSVKDGQKIKLELEGKLPDDVVVELNGGNVVLTGNEDAKATGELTLNPLDPNASNAADRFSNTATIKLGDKIYTLHIRQLLKPQIKLNYGNSPYGEIMRDDAIVDKEAAKNAFNVNNKYATGFIPKRIQSVIDASSVIKAAYTYASRAWVDIEDVTSIKPDEAAKIADPKINLDRDPYALFAYNGKTFKDAGFIATDSLGKTINEVDCKVAYKRAGDSDFKGMQTSKLIAETYTEKHLAAGNEITKLTYAYTGSNGRFIASNVYDMEYTFVDPNTSEEAKVIRKLIILASLGDTDLDGEVTGNDRNFINSYVANRDVPEKEKYLETMLRIYLYRVAGTSTEANEITANDRNTINALVANKLPRAPQMYVDIE